MTSSEPGEVTADGASPGDDDDEATHPASTAKAFSEAELAWGAVLYKSGRYFTTHAAKYPPKELQKVALALGLLPNASGEIFANRRAKRLLFVVRAMRPEERSHRFLFAQQVLEASADSQGELTAVQPGDGHPLLLDPPQSVSTWRLPRSDEVLPPVAVDVSAPLAKREALLLASRVQHTLTSFKVDAEVRELDISIGPTVIRIGIRPTGQPIMAQDDREHPTPARDASGNIVYKTRTKVSQILKLQDDFALALEAKSIRMEAPVPGRPYVGIEIPAKQSRLVTLREILESSEFLAAKATSKLSVALGRDVAGAVRVGDLAQMPHLLIAGATGAGKSVQLNAIIASLIMTNTPDDVRLLLIDPKMVELNMYTGVPHLLSPVVTEVEKVVPLLKNATSEMERRYRLFSRLSVRNLDSYRKLRAEKLAHGDSQLQNLPAIVIIIDELADLMMTAPEDIESLICRLAQLARATGIHLVIATQRPSVDVITGLIKANIPARISFMVSSAVDSRTIIDMGGAEHLLGRGDMLYLPPDIGKPERIQGAFVADKQAESIAEYWRNEWARQRTGAGDPIAVGPLFQPPLEPDWTLADEDAPVDPSAATPGVQPKEETTLLDHLKAFLKEGTLSDEGTPIPVPLSRLSYEDQILVAEALIWRGCRGSAEKLNQKLKTKLGPRLRDALVERGLMDKLSQTPLRPSVRLAPLLLSCGLIHAENGELMEHAESEDDGTAEDEDSAEVAASSASS